METDCGILLTLKNEVKPLHMKQVLAYYNTKHNKVSLDMVPFINASEPK